MRMTPLVLALLLVTALLPTAFAADEASGPADSGCISKRTQVLAQLGAEPEGFGWVFYGDAAVLKPTGWFEHALTNKVGPMSEAVHAMSPVDFGVSKPFSTGFTVKILTGMNQHLKTPASQLVLSIIRPDLQVRRKDEVLMLDNATEGEYEVVYFRYIDASPGLPPIMVHKYFVAHNAADTLYSFIFESPVQSWAEQWSRHGSPILSKLSVFPGTHCQAAPVPAPAPASKASS